jgi:hypothetical protein
LGEFSPIWQLFTLGSVLKITEVMQILGYYFSRYQLFTDFEKQLVGPHIGRFFLQTHRVTLIIGQRRAAVKNFHFLLKPTPPAVTSIVVV